MSRHIYHLFLSLCLVGIGQIAHAQEASELEPNQPVERQIAGGESQTYEIRLSAGQFMRITAEQKAIDVTLTLAAPDGKQLIEMNLTGAGGVESLSAEAPVTGAYRLTLRAAGSAALAGSYQARLDVKPSAEPQDRQRISAEQLMLEAFELKKQGAKTAEQTIEKLQQALAVLRETGEQRWIAWSLSGIGVANSSLSRHEKAIEFLKQALTIQRAGGDRSGEGATLNSLGFAYFSLSNLEKAIENYEPALAIAREVKSRNDEANTLLNIGSVKFNLSRFETALEYREQALAAYRETKNRAGEASALNAMGSVYSSLGKYEKAIEFYKQALAIHREVKNRAGEGIIFHNLGRTYQTLSRFEKAIEFLEQALAIHREVKQRTTEGSALNALGNAYVGLGNYEKASENYQQALTIAREVKNRFGEANALDNLGNVYINLGDNQKAVEYVEQALAITRQIKNRAGEGNALYKLGLVNFNLNRFDKAVEFHEQALTIAREVKIRIREADALYSLAQTHLAQGNVRAAQSRIEESLKVSESLRSDLLSPESRASFLANVQHSYRIYTDLLMRRHRAEPTKNFDALAVEVSERQRARSLLDMLAESGTDLRRDIAPELIKREEILAEQLSDKARQLTQAAKSEQIAALKREISQLENDYEQAQIAIRKASPQYAALTQTQPLKLKEIQAQLDVDTLLLEYSLGEERSYLWAITKDSLTSYELPKEQEIKKDALAVYDLLTARNTKKSGETALQRKSRIMEAEAKLPTATLALSDMLLAPVAAQLGSKQLVIVADGALQYIPFAMLPDPMAGGRNQPPANNLQPLIVNHEVVSLPSASALAVQRTELADRPIAPKMLAVIADPVFDKMDARFKSATAGTNDKAQLQTVAFTDERSLEHITDESDEKETRRLVIRRLPFTRQEADGLLALAPKSSRFGATGFQANRATVLSGDLAQYRFVHFATHGLLDTERPGLSSLMLSMFDTRGKTENGFLRVNDIYNMKLPAELVVLSACQTGLGKEIRGEGLIGLTRGFMYAGARRVVVSLWSVNDKATAGLMEKFYSRMLKDNERPAAALRAAQIEMWKQKAWQSPYYWSAFVIQGEWR
jgi:CHAT domain-containing protein/uncharacterized protein HemY